MARKLDKADREALGRCAHHLGRMEEYGLAAEVYSKMGDVKALIAMRVEAKHWDDVSSLPFIMMLCVVSPLTHSLVRDWSFINGEFSMCHERKTQRVTEGGHLSCKNDMVLFCWGTEGIGTTPHHTTL